MQTHGRSFPLGLEMEQEWMGGGVDRKGEALEERRMDHNINERKLFKLKKKENKRQYSSACLSVLQKMMTIPSDIFPQKWSFVV